MSEKVNELLFESFPKLSSDRFDLVEINEAHLENVFELYSDEKVTEFFDLLPLQHINEAEKEIKFYQKRFQNNSGIRWGISFKGSSEIIGTLGFNTIIKGHKARLGYDLQSKHWGKGYMYEALDTIITYGFEKFDIKRIEAGVMQGNVGSEKLLAKLNFQKEGILRNWMYWNEEYYDISMFSLLKEDRVGTTQFIE